MLSENVPVHVPAIEVVPVVVVVVGVVGVLEELESLPQLVARTLNTVATTSLENQVFAYKPRQSRTVGSFEEW